MEITVTVLSHPVQNTLVVGIYRSKTGRISQLIEALTHLHKPVLTEPTIAIIIHQTHCEKSDWSRAFNQFTIACELDIINAISAVDIAFIVSSSTSAWLLRGRDKTWGGHGLGHVG